MFIHILQPWLFIIFNFMGLLVQSLFLTDCSVWVQSRQNGVHIYLCPFLPFPFYFSPSFLFLFCYLNGKSESAAHYAPVCHDSQQVSIMCISVDGKIYREHSHLSLTPKNLAVVAQALNCPQTSCSSQSVVQAFMMDCCLSLKGKHCPHYTIIFIMCS